MPDDLAERARPIFAPHRVGRPGRGAGYWPLWVLAQGTRVHWHIRVTGVEHIAAGPAILAGNHLRAVDPVLLGVALRRRLVFIAKAEALTGVAGVVLRGTGQVPLIRGDVAATSWALDACGAALRAGRIVGIYPEATRSPDGRSLHRLHERILAPLVVDNPDVPVHAVAVGYRPPRRGRVRVDLRFSPALEVGGTAAQITATVRDALLDLGGMPYVDRSGAAVKAARSRYR